jgi:hypothetical protein
MCKCDPIFTEFQWKDLVTLSAQKLPKTTGVYAIRISKKGEPIKRVISNAYKLLGKIDWSQFEHHVLSRVRRLEEIRECPIIYIGAAPTSLKGRYKDLCGRRHTAFYAIIALLFAGWKLDFGWIEDEKPLQKEKRLKRQYSNIHGRLPAVVKR